MNRLRGFEIPLLMASRNTRIEKRFPTHRLVVMIDAYTFIDVEVDTHVFSKAWSFITIGALVPVGFKNVILVVFPTSLTVAFAF